MRRVNQAIWLITTGAKNAAFRNIKTIAECLADELMGESRADSTSEVMETLSAELSSTLKKGREGLTSKVDQGLKLRDEFVQELSSNFQSVPMALKKSSTPYFLCPKDRPTPSRTRLCSKLSSRSWTKANRF